METGNHTLGRGALGKEQSSSKHSLREFKSILKLWPPPERKRKKEKKNSYILLSQDPERQVDPAECPGSWFAGTAPGGGNSGKAKYIHLLDCR